MEELKIAVCVPIHVSAQIPINFFINFINRLGDLKPEYHPEILFSTKSPLDRSRNYLVEMALNKKATHIWFIDTDMVIPKGTLEALLEMNVPIASALYFEKGIPYWPCIRKNDNGIWKKTEEIKWNQHMPIDGVGMGCCLIRTDIFQKIPKPWFKWVIEEDMSLGEDIYFCNKAKENGFQSFINTNFVVAHHGGLVTEKEFYAYADMRKGALESSDIEKWGTIGHANGIWQNVKPFIPKTQTEKKLLNLGCGNHIPDLSGGNLFYEISYCDIRPQSHFNFPNYTECDLNKDFPYRDKSFDGILAIELIEHLENPRHFLRECQRVAKDFIIITFPNCMSPKSKAEFSESGRFAWFDQQSYEKCKHITPIFGWQIDQISSELGLRIDKIAYNNDEQEIMIIKLVV